MHDNLRSLLQRLWRQIRPCRRRQFLWIIWLGIVTGFSEVLSLGAVLPFLGVMTAPERVVKFPLVHRAMTIFGVTTNSQLVLLLAVAFGVAAVVAGTLRLLLLWSCTRAALATGADFSSEAYRRTLYQPYQVHVMRNSSDFISGIVGKVSDTIQVLSLLLTVINSAILLIFITTALLVINPVIASSAIVGFGGCYLAIMRITRRRLRDSGRRISLEQSAVIKALQEGIGGIRDVLLDGTQPVYYEIFRQADRSLRRALGTVIFVSNSPRFLMEALGMVLIATLAFAITRTAGGIATALPVLGVIAFGAQRLLPVLQQAYGAWATIVGSQGSLSATLDLLEQPVDDSVLASPPAPISFHQGVCFDSVRFRYTDDGPWVLDGLNLTIPRGSRIGFVGTTGSGKSTALDLLMGLLAPTEGRVLVDGLPVAGARVRAWQSVIAHVPQHVFLADSSIAENIALGVNPPDIDLDRVRQAAGQAQISDFIDGRPEGYAARVGERGIRLSGGQRQRIGIARALYKRASVLIFDEATSALDNATEQLVMKAIDVLNRDLTIVMIAHRLSTVRHCDLIVELDRGKVFAQGTYEELLETSPSFRYMARTIA